MDLLCLCCGAIGVYGPKAEFRPSGDEVWCMACGDILTDLIPVVTGDYDGDADRYVYIAEPSGNVVLFEHTDPPHARGYWRTTDLTGRSSPFGIARREPPDGRFTPLRPWLVSWEPDA